MIASSGLYWVTVIPAGALTISADGRHAVLDMHDVEVIDQPTFPAHAAPATPARMTYRAEWEATDERAEYVDALKQYRFTGWRARGRLEASVTVPSTGFSWKSDPIADSNAAFGVIGDEVNGRYFTA